MTVRGDVVREHEGDPLAPDYIKAPSFSIEFHHPSLPLGTNTSSALPPDHFRNVRQRVSLLVTRPQSRVVS